MANGTIAFPIPSAPYLPDGQAKFPTYSQTPAVGEIVGRNLVPSPKVPVNGEPVIDAEAGVTEDTIAARGFWRGPANNPWGMTAEAVIRGGERHTGIRHWYGVEASTEWYIAAPLCVNTTQRAPNLAGTYDVWVLAGDLAGESPVYCFVRPERISGSGVPSATTPGLSKWGTYFSTALPPVDAPLADYVPTYAQTECNPAVTTQGAGAPGPEVMLICEKAEGNTYAGNFMEKIRVDWAGSTYAGYFDGDTPDTEFYQFDWTGQPGASASTVTLIKSLDAPPPNEPPAAPTGLTASHITESGVTLNWTAPADTDLAEYRVYRSGVADPVATVPAPTTTAVITGLPSYSTVSFFVRAVDTGGLASGDSDPVDVLTLPPTGPEATLPDPPTGLKATQITETTVRLHWDPPAETANVFAYRVYRDNDQHLVDAVAAPDTRTTITGLPADTAMSFFVKTVDQQNRLSGPSEPVSVRTLAYPLPPAAAGRTRNMQKQLRDTIQIYRGLDAATAVTVSAYVGSSVIDLTSDPAGWVVVEETVAIVGPETVVAELDHVIWREQFYIVTAVRHHRRPTDTADHHLTLILKGWTEPEAGAQT